MSKIRPVRFRPKFTVRKKYFVKKNEKKKDEKTDKNNYEVRLLDFNFINPPLGEYCKQQSEQDECSVGITA